MDKTYSPALELMIEFARLTGLKPVSPTPRRYLWTDAFAVCNYLELFERTGDQSFRQLALDLVDQVHNVLGRHRMDDERTGWISGLDDETGREHPTMGGLRIGKQLKERGVQEPYDDQREWDRDGQYYHYLTKWMHALARVGSQTGDRQYIVWAIELARSVHPRFTYTSSVDGRKYMRWKMSIDLSRPLVPAMGQHDPLDGFVTCCELQMQAAGAMDASLAEEINDLDAICREQNWATDDPLGIGGLLADAYRLARMIDRHGLESPVLLDDLLASSLAGLQACIRSGSLNLPPEYRLAFRELGLAIGLHGVERLQELALQSAARGPLAALSDPIARLLEFCPLAGQIEQFWLKPAHQQVPAWEDHREINMVMLATSLLPDGFLNL